MNILLVRHGDDDFDAGAASIGRAQMIENVHMIKKDAGVAPGAAYIVSSETRRAALSAEVLAEGLGVREVENVSWLSDGTGRNPYGKLMEYADVHDDAVVIAVTHLPEMRRILTKAASAYETAVDTDAARGDVYLIDTDAHIVKRIEK